MDHPIRWSHYPQVFWIGVCSVKGSHMVVVDRVFGLVGLGGVVWVLLRDLIIPDYFLRGLKLVVIPVRYDGCVKLSFLKKRCVDFPGLVREG